MKISKKCATILSSLSVGILITLLLAIVFTPTALAADSPNTYYVTKTGSNTTGDGSSTKPWNTIQFGIDKLSAGKTLIIGEGVYNEKLSVSVSGAAGNYVIIKGADGKRVVVDGTGINSNNGSNNHMVYLSNRSYVRIENLEICNNNSNVRDWNVNSGIYVETSSSGGSVGIQLVNNRIHNIDGESFHYQSSSEGGPNGYGIAVNGRGTNEDRAIRDLLIEGNEVYDCKLGWSESVVVNGNVVDWKIINNYIHDNDNIGIDAAGGWGVAGGSSAVDRVRNGVIAGNVIINNTGQGNLACNGGGGADGIYVDGGKDILIENNFVAGSAYGIETGTENGSSFRPSGIIIRNNVVSYNSNGGILVGGTNGALDTLVENNTVYQTSGNGIERNAGAGPYNIVNNVIITTGNVPYVSGSGGTAIFTNNVYYGGLLSRPLGDDNGQVVTTQPVTSLTSGNFTPNGNITGGARLTATTTPSLAKAMANYAARVSALPAQSTVYGIVNNTTNKGASNKLLTLSVIGNNICRYFENLPGVAGTGAKVYMKYANTSGSTYIDNDNADRYYGIVTVRQAADGQINLNKITQARAITNMRVYLSFPYIANGQTSWIEQQVNSVCVNFDPAAQPGVNYNVTVNGSYASPTGAGSYASGATVTISAGSRSGYTFTGWTTTTSGVTFANANAATTTFTMPSRAVAVTANWSRYTLMYHQNGGSGTKPSDQTGGSVTVSGAGNLNRSNYTFTGWNTQSNGAGTTYQPGDQITLLANMMLYAQWTYTAPTVYLVTVNGSYASTTGAGGYASGATVTISADSRSGYTFTGWTTTTSGVSFANAGAATTTFTMPSRAVTVTANWSRYTLTYNANNGSGTKPSNQTGGSVTVSGAGNLNRTGYTFAGWNTQSNGAGAAYQPGDQITLTANLTLYAQWARTSTRILIYNANGGSGTKPADQTGVSVTLSGQYGLYRSGYFFAGWNTQSNGAGTSYQPGIQMDLTGDMTLYAQWSTIRTLTYNVNGGSGTKPPDQAGGSVTLSGQHGLYRSGYTFTGWNSQSNGRGTAYQSGQIITLTSNITLYAQWTQIQ